MLLLIGENPVTDQHEIANIIVVTGILIFMVLIWLLVSWMQILSILVYSSKQYLYFLCFLVLDC